MHRAAAPSGHLSFQKLLTSTGMNNITACFKRVCGVERFRVRGKVPILNHIFAALCSFVQKCGSPTPSSAYLWKTFTNVVAAFFVTHRCWRRLNIDQLGLAEILDYLGR
jgi:hypothetical protein